MAITFYVLLWAGGGNDIIATHFELSINDITNFLRVAVFVVPPHRLRRHQADLPGRCSAATGSWCCTASRRGRIVRLPHGEFIEVHEPL